MDIQLPQIIFQIINFGVVFGAVTYLLNKPVQKILDDRAKRVADSVIEAQKIETEKGTIQELKAKTKRTAEKQAAVILEKAQKTANSKKQELVAKTKESLQAEMKKAQASWKQEKQQLISDSKKEMVDAVVEVSSIVLGKKIDSKTDEKLISKSLEEVLKNI